MNSPSTVPALAPVEAQTEVFPASLPTFSLGGVTTSNTPVRVVSGPGLEPERLHPGIERIEYGQ